MKNVSISAALFVLHALGAPAIAGTVTNTIPVSAQIVPGNSVSVYAIGGQLYTVTRTVDTRNSIGRIPGVAIATISFETKPSWRIVKRVAFDKSKHLLTIDF